MKKALITGITGQDGSYLAEFLLSKGYEVHGIVRRASTSNDSRIGHICSDPHDPGTRMFLHFGDLSDSEQIVNLVYNINPAEVYNLGAQSHVGVSFDMAEYTGDITGLGATRMLEAIRRSGRKIRFYQASSSEMFGNAPAPQNEATSFCPCSPYGTAKVYACWMVRNYRLGYGMFACNGICFNHESPRRGDSFVSKKITRAVVDILAGRKEKLFLGNLDVRRDWGFAPEYVQGMWAMLQNDVPDDFVLGTGMVHSVKDFVSEAFGYAGLDWQRYVEYDKDFVRANEIELLCADAAKARKVLGWEARVDFKALVKIMMDAEMRVSGAKPVGEGDRLLKELFPERWWKFD